LPVGAAQEELALALKESALHAEREEAARKVRRRPLDLFVAVSVCRKAYADFRWLFRRV
jgi:hypothetical protein